MLKICHYTEPYALLVAELFTAAVHAIDDEVYSPLQKQAWAPEPFDETLWRSRLLPERCFLALHEQTLLGFIELDGDYIDCCYVHPQFQGQGVASALYQHIETLALQRGLERLWVDASKRAKQFFVGQGFMLLKQNQVHIRGQTLENYSMSKDLTALSGW
ncbi:MULTISPECIES: GNAT family N-acetyltransferase [unclassified Agarivorans]|uniref:GNAT family N-acetyltransferase n=1 Tax=unclassified Agarivorans TaxID=2636026 RepID=UPI003D7CF28F